MATLADELKQVPLFSGLSQRQLKRLARDFREREIKSGTPVMREGEKSGISFFVIVDGTATVSADGTQVGQLGPGDHFGELALISENVRSATVTASIWSAIWSASTLRGRWNSRPGVGFRHELAGVVGVGRTEPW